MAKYTMSDNIKNEKYSLTVEDSWPHKELTKLKFPVQIFDDSGNITKSQEYFKLKDSDINENDDFDEENTNLKGLYRDDKNIQDKLNSDHENGTFAMQTKTGFKYFRMAYRSVGAYMRYLQKKNMCNLYEVLTNNIRKIYFDLEAEINTISIREQATFIKDYLNVFEYFKICLRRYLKDVCRFNMYDENTDIIIHSHDITDEKVKISFHYIIPSVCMERKQMISMIINFINSEFIPYCDRMRNNGAISLPNGFKFIDTSVYSRNRNFRILANTKFNSNRYLVCDKKVNILDTLINYNVANMADQIYDMNQYNNDLKCDETEKNEIDNNKEYTHNFEYIAQLFAHMKNNFDYNNWLAVGFAIKSTNLTEDEKIYIFTKFTQKYEKFKYDDLFAQTSAENIIRNSNNSNKPITMGSILWKDSIFYKNIDPEFWQKFGRRSNKKILESFPVSPLSMIDQYDEYTWSDALREIVQELPYASNEEMFNKIIPKLKRVIILCGKGYIIKEIYNNPGIYYSDFPKNANINIFYYSGEQFDKKTGEKQQIKNKIKLNELLINDLRPYVTVCDYINCDPIINDPKCYNTWAHPLYVKTNIDFIKNLKTSVNFNSSDIVNIDGVEMLSKNYIDNYIKNTNVLDSWLNFIKNVWANDRDEIYRYLLARDREIIINYKNPSEVAIFAKSEQGTGKNTKLEFIANHVLGRHMCYTYNGVEATNKDFNSELVNKIYILVDECAIVGKDKFKLFDNMKAKITGKTININGKFKDPFEIRNLLNIDFLSNHEDAIYLEQNDRRYLVITMGNWHVNDSEYWQEFYKTNFNDITGLMYMYYLYYDIGNNDLESINLRNVPMTPEKKDLIDLYLDSTIKFLADKKDYLINKYGNSTNEINDDDYNNAIKNIVNSFQNGEISAVTMTDMIAAVEKPGINILTDNILYLEYERFAKDIGNFVESKAKFLIKIKNKIKKNLLNNCYDPRTISVKTSEIMQNNDNEYHYLEQFIKDKLAYNVSGQIAYSRLRESYIKYIESLDIDNKDKYLFNQKIFTEIIAKRLTSKIIHKQKFIIGWKEI